MNASFRLHREFGNLERRAIVVAVRRIERQWRLAGVNYLVTTGQGKCRRPARRIRRISHQPMYGSIPVLVVPYGYNEGRPASSIDADGVVDSLADVAGWLA